VRRPSSAWVDVAHRLTDVIGDRTLGTTVRSTVRVEGEARDGGRRPRLRRGVNALGSDTLGRDKLNRAAIAGPLADVAPREPCERAWPDGAAVFVAAEANPRARLRRVAVRASLLGAASLEPDVVARLRRRPALSRRYLAVEGHRALAAHEPLL